MTVKYIAVGLAATVVVVGGLAVTLPELLSTESTSTVGSTATAVPRAEVEKQVRENYALPLVQKKPQEVNCAGDLSTQQNATVECTVTPKDGKKQRIAVSVTAISGTKVSYDYAVVTG